MAKRPRYDGPVTLDVVQEEPEAQITRRTTSDLSEYVALLERSRAKAKPDGKGIVLGMNVPEAAYGTIESRFRAAARQMGPDVGIALGKAKDNPGPGLIRVLVQTKPKKARPANGTADKPAAKKGLPPVKAKG